MDSRNIKNGFEIPREGYSDQPYLLKMPDGAWLMCITTGKGHEGQNGQHVVTARSFDRGKTWIDVADVESADNPESSYAVMHLTAYGRVYCFYNYNKDNLRYVLADDPPFPGGTWARADSQGYFVFKYSDDCGKTWSDKFYEIPIRKFAVDYANHYGGDIMLFWNVGKPFITHGGVAVSLYKIGRNGYQAFTNTEGVLLFSANLETEKDPEKLTWETLPDGDVGIRTPRDVSHVSEEHSYVVLSDGTIFVVFRTVSSYSYCAYSHDGGHTFTEPERMRYADGRFIHHPRAANFVWKCKNGKYLYWFHNNRYDDYSNRNPVWISGAVEYKAEDGMRLKFSQPEILLYDEDIHSIISYPDMIEDIPVESGESEYYISETQKYFARLHKIDKSLIEGLWAQFEDDVPADTGIPVEKSLPPIKPLGERAHFSDSFGTQNNEVAFALRFDFTVPEKDEILFSNMDDTGKGLKAVYNSATTRIEFTMGDGHCISRFDSEKNILKPGMSHNVAIIVDGGPHVIEFVIDGLLCMPDDRMFGFGRFNQYTQDINGKETLETGTCINNLKFYDGLLRISDAIRLQQAKL
ncbi:MAG TPA: sialidase family protein [Oscillospiraceae bacterium]|nr:sialidase family protein [Oscillospiraceae bacterium]HPF55657.1 sialidase family protein [Clostridiales bacterium]HPK34725.1 sialidase family protein [Oscillospiraceae bacterium]HPR76057.1 sialidase family protein [Oscillospiraceae bacterium]